MEDLLVSVITPCYNSEKTIRDTIRSVLNQTYQNLEYLIIDGASTDRTLEIIGEFQDPRIRVVSETDRGVYDAMNKGIRMAEGSLVGIINSDDWYEPDAVEEMVREFDAGSMQIHYGALAIWYGETLEMQQLIYESALYRSMIAHPTCFVAKAVYDELGLYDTQYSMTADYEFMVRCKKSGKVSFIAHEKRIADFRMGGLSSAAATKDIAYRENLLVRKRYGLIGESYFKKEMRIVNVKGMIKRLAAFGKKH